jgi:hypothetical protein
MCPPRTVQYTGFEGTVMVDTRTADGPGPAPSFVACPTFGSQALALAIAATLGLGSTASAGVLVFTTQTREITASVEDRLNGFNETNSASSADFGPFNQGVSAAVLSGPGVAHASQNSVLDPFAGIQTNVSVSAIGSINYQQRATASSLCFVQFDVTEPCDAILWFSGFAADFNFVGPGMSFSMMDTFGPAPIALVPGTYTMQSSVSIANGSSQGFGSGMSARLTVPSPSTAILLLAALRTAARRRR